MPHKYRLDIDEIAQIFVTSCTVCPLLMRYPQPLQEALHPFSLLGQKWAKSALIIDEYDLGSLEVDNHIGLMIAVNIDEAEGHRNEVGVRTVELRADVDTSVAGITAGQFDDLNTPMEVDRQKMTRHAR